jgi:hemerythrin
LTLQITYYGIVNESLDVLVEYCVEHFEYEENILKSRNYPKLDSHIKAHEDFKEKIDFFRKSASNGNGNIIDSMIIYLIGWIKNHTYYDDLDYKNYL